MACQETKVLLTEKSKKALGLSTRNAELDAEVESLRGELAQREEELVQKDASLEKAKEELTKDVANSYLMVLTMLLPKSPMSTLSWTSPK